MKEPSICHLHPSSRHITSGNMYSTSLPKHQQTWIWTMRSSTCHGQLDSSLQPHFYEICLTTTNRQFHPKPSHNQSNQPLAGFKKGINREVKSYPTLKDERYVDSFSQSLYITSKSHDCDGVLDADLYT